MQNILLLFLCLIAGILLQRVKSWKNTAYAFNQFVIYISLPALVLHFIPTISWSKEMLFPVGIAWLNFALSFLFFSLVGKKFGWSKKLIGCLILTTGLGNTSFVGFPIVEALYGQEGLKWALLIDQPGSFVVLATLGVWVASSFSSKKLTSREILVKISTFPPFIAFIVAMTIGFFQLKIPVEIDGAFERIGATVSPLALVSVGLQLRIIKQSKHFGFLALGLFFKLVAFPLIVFFLYRFVFKLEGMMLGVSTIEAAMAPMITASILASTNGLKPQLSTQMIGFGIPISFITIGIFYFLLL